MPGPISSRLAARSMKCLPARRPFLAIQLLLSCTRLVHQSPAPPAGLRPGTDPCLQVVALKALANDPEDRYTDCREMAAALLDCLSKPAATPDTAHERSKPALASTKPNTEAPRTKLVGRRARTALITAAAIVVFRGLRGHLLCSQTRATRSASRPAPASRDHARRRAAHLQPSAISPARSNRSESPSLQTLPRSVPRPVTRPATGLLQSIRSRPDLWQLPTTSPPCLFVVTSPTNKVITKAR